MSTLEQKDDATYMAAYEEGRADGARRVLAAALVDGYRWLTPAAVGDLVARAGLVHRLNRRGELEADRGPVPRADGTHCLPGAYVPPNVEIPPNVEGSQ